MTRKITIEIGEDEIEEICLGLSDLLCWCRGFKAAAPEDADRHPLGVWAARNIKDRLREELHK